MAPRDDQPREEEAGLGDYLDQNFGTNSGSGSLKAGYTNPSPPQPLTGAPSYPTSGSSTFVSPPGYRGPDYSGFSGSYGGAPGQFNFTDPNNRPPPISSPSTPASWNRGGGWGESWATGDPYVAALSSAFGRGLTGQAAVDWTNQQPGANGIAYYADTNRYGLPNSSSNPYGSYVAAGGNGALDLIRRAQAEGGGTGAGTYGDPAFQQLLQLATQRINSLMSPTSFPGLDKLTSMLTANEQAAKDRAATFAGQLQPRIAQLQQPLMSDSEAATQRAQVMNRLEAQRTQALKNSREQIYARGFAPTSGLVDNDQRAINERYDNSGSNIDAALLNSNIQTNEQRRNQATQLQGLVQQALQGGDVTALQNQAQVADLENQLYNINQGRSREALTTAQIPVDLSQTGFNNSLQSLGAGGSPMSALSGLFNLLGLGQNSQQIGINQSASNNAGTAQWLNMLLGLIK